ncbi:hypothetical protein ACU4GD_15315 [Cupriavidus basilensis]
MVTGRLRVVIVKIHLYTGLTLGLLFVMRGPDRHRHRLARRTRCALLNPGLLTALGRGAAAGRRRRRYRRRPTNCRPIRATAVPGC